MSSLPRQPSVLSPTIGGVAPISAQSISSATLKTLALSNGFDLAGIAAAGPLAEADQYLTWARNGMAGKMGYLTDHRAEKRRDPRNLLPSARSVLVVGQLYNAPIPYSTAFPDETLGWISRYAWGDDYHLILRTRLEEIDRQLRALTGCETKICKIGRAVQQECRDRSRMPSSA
eukprot:TRINITY_DN21626_c0_g1_i1.p2 TRINITY_DN21626_c0_g1~~TRINITY_DN21626_c0_g1_i1.p2  ORF type:complete len:174 (-),score=25.96 TRINITY_DN21626_c0_g1_i1:11-532(-)